MNESISESGSDAPARLNELADLLGKKSVRATFKLRPAVIELFSILASQLGIKQKSLLEYLMEDMDALRTIAATVTSPASDIEKRIQKTFVVNQKALSVLEEVAKKYSASRNDLIEYSVGRLLRVFEKERERQVKREKALLKVGDHFNQGNTIVDEVKRLVGEEDTLFRSFESVIDSYAKVYAEMQKIVQKGKRISEFQIDELRQNRS